MTWIKFQLFNRIVAGVYYHYAKYPSKAENPPLVLQQYTMSLFFRNGRPIVIFLSKKIALYEYESQHCQNGALPIFPVEVLGLYLNHCKYE